MSEEEWREVPGSDGWYEVSDLGRVRSWYLAGHSGVRREVPLIRRAHAKDTGHLVLTMKTLDPPHRSVHSLVAEAFIGPRPEGTEVRHLDGNPCNNHRSNLCYGTRAENIEDRYLHGGGTAGENYGATKLTDQQVEEIRHLASRGELFQYQIAAMYGVSQTCVSLIHRRERRVPHHESVARRKSTSKELTNV